VGQGGLIDDLDGFACRPDRAHRFSSDVHGA
jgi:hypothetical protein